MDLFVIGLYVVLLAVAAYAAGYWHDRARAAEKQLQRAVRRTEGERILSRLPGHSVPAEHEARIARLFRTWWP